MDKELTNVQDGVSSFLFNIKDYWSPLQKATLIC